MSVASPTGCRARSRWHGRPEHSQIPTWFKSCFPYLAELDMSFNTLTGTLPPEMAENELLEEFEAHHNNLHGPLVSESAARPRTTAGSLAPESWRIVRRGQWCPCPICTRSQGSGGT